VTPNWKAGLLAGAIAIVANILILQLGTLLHITSGHGGLLRWLAATFDFAPIPWNRGALQFLSPRVWKLIFHFAVGIVFAVVYIGAIERILAPRLGAIIAGAAFALGVWLVNAFLILPALGMGIAGIAELSPSGILYFALAHTVFFILLAWLYSRWRTTG